MLYLNFTQN